MEWTTKTSQDYNEAAHINALQDEKVDKDTVENNINDYDSFSDAIDSIGGTESTLLIYDQQDVGVDKTVPSNVTIRFSQGGSLNISVGKTVTINGHVEAGLYQIFEGSGTVVFGSSRTVYPEWWYSSGEWGTSINKAIASIRSIGGVVRFSTSMTITTSIDGTNISTGMIFEGVSGAFSSGGARLIGELTTVLFDCTGSRYLKFKDFVIKGDSSTTPKVGFLLARKSTGASAGEHIFDNIKSDYNSHFSVSVIYSYGSEVNIYYSCNFVNNYAGGKTFVSTSNNVNSLTSAYQTIDTGSQSNSVTGFYGCNLYNLGGATSDVFYLEGADDFHVYGGWWYCATASANGRAYVYIDTTNVASNYLSFDGIRGEPGTYEAEYGFYFGDTAKIPYSISISNNRMGANTAMLYAHNNVQLYALNVSNTAGIISVYSIRDSIIKSGTYILRAGGTQVRCNIDTESAPTITGSSSADIITNRAAGDIKTAYGFFHSRGYPTSVDFDVGDLTTDATWNSLDLSSIVDAGAKTVLLSIQLGDDAVGSLLSFQDTNNASVVTLSQVATQVANIDIYADIIVPMTSAYLIYYKGSNLAFVTINIVVRGWWK